MAVNGIDIASYQSIAYGTQGLGFVFVKATEGTNYLNPRYSAQIAHGRQNALMIGHYHFVRPGSMSAQVSYFLQHVSLKSGDVLCLDWEDPGVSSADKDAFLKGLKAQTPSHKVVLYCNRDFWLNRDRSSYAADGLWIADPSAPAGAPRIQHPWLFHQYGESGGVDLDLADFPSKAALLAWAGATTPPTAPTPASRTQEDPMPQPIDLWAYRNKAADDASLKASGKHIPDAYGYLVDTHALLNRLLAQEAAQNAAITALAQQLGKNSQDAATIVQAVTKAIADATVHVTVDVSDGTTPQTPAS